MTDNYKQIEECFISIKAHNTYSTMTYQDQAKVKPYFRVIATGSPSLMPLRPVPGIVGNFIWRYDLKYSFILKTFMGRLVLEDIVLNSFLDQVYGKQ